MIADKFFFLFFFVENLGAQTVGNVVHGFAFSLFGIRLATAQKVPKGTVFLTK